jgi:ketosteroid isomerase-like protein
MYHAIVRRRVAQTFEALSRGEYEFALAGMAPRFEHIFAGNHALGGTRHTVAGMRLWFERMFRLNKKLNFTIKHIAVSGTPWDTTAIIEWRDTATLANGDTSYFNDGTHVIRMRWGKVVSLHAYLDTEKVVTVLRQMAEHGFAEAVAAPIED